MIWDWLMLIVGLFMLVVCLDFVLAALSILFNVVIIIIWAVAMIIAWPFQKLFGDD